MIFKFKEFWNNFVFEDINHLKKRGVSKENTKFIYDEMSGDIFFFLYNLSGQIVGYQKYNPKYPKNKGAKDPRENRYFSWIESDKIAVWGLETTDWRDKYIFITEGIFDCVRIHRAGEPGIATLCNDPSPSMRSWLSTMPQKKIVIYDNDSAGIKLKTCGDYSFTVPKPYKDLGEMEQEEATKFIKNIIKNIK